MKQPFSLSRRAAAISLLAALHATGHAQEAWPQKPIRIVIGFSAGGGTDAVLRAIAVRLGPVLGTDVVVENRPGANGNLAAEAVAKAAHDGYTLLYNTSSIVTSPFLYPKLNYSLAGDFTPVALTANVPMVLVSGPSTKAANLQEFVSQLRAAPNAMTYASAGQGNITQLSALLFQRAFNVRATNVTYKGEAPGLVDVMGGHVNFAVFTAAGAAPLVKEGRLRALAVFSAQRLDALPDVPTLAEAGGKALELGSWSGIMAPARTPPAVVARLNAAVNTVLKDASLRQAFATAGATPQGGTVASYAAFLRSEGERWGALIKAENLQGE